MKGSYLLILRNNKRRKIEVGALGKLKFLPGYYIYVGSALNNLKKRIERHKKKKKKRFWHIDYLTNKFQFLWAKKFPTDKKKECQIASLLKRRLLEIKGFGASDCNCSSHLFYSSILQPVRNFPLTKGNFLSNIKVKNEEEINKKRRTKKETPSTALLN